MRYNFILQGYLESFYSFTFYNLLDILQIDQIEFFFIYILTKNKYTNLGYHYKNILKKNLKLYEMIEIFHTSLTDIQVYGTYIIIGVLECYVHAM